MANSLALANGPQGIDINAVRVYEREKLVRYAITLTGVYVQHVRGQNVGEVIDLTKNLTNANYSPSQYWSPKGPSRMYVLNAGGTGYSMSIVPGADSLHWLLCIFSTVTGELNAGGYPAGLLADLDIIIEASGRAFD